MRSMAQSVPVMVVKEPVSVADRQKKIVNTKTDVKWCKYKTQKKTFEKNKAIFFERWFIATGAQSAFWIF